MADTATIYLNPRCSKSRAALEYLEQTSLHVIKIEYLKHPPDKQTLLEILNELQLKPRQLMRRGDATYKQLDFKDESLSDDQLVDTMVAHPILIERPIVRFQGEAVIGRPLDKVIDLVDE